MNNIIEAFISIQGEGLRTGRPTIFVRLKGCNLRCVFHNSDGKTTSICDTSYASFGTSEYLDHFSDERVMNMLYENPQIHDVVITGGEPLIYISELEEFIKRLRTVRDDFAITIETNGTLAPSDYLLEQVDLWSVSPKLSSSVPTVKDCKKQGIPDFMSKAHDTARINLYALTSIASRGHYRQFKFVYTGKECVDEIQQLIARIQGGVNIAVDDGTCDPLDVNELVMLMPEGITKKAILDKSDECINVCIDHGWTYTTRMHILVWGNVKEK